MKEANCMMDKQQQTTNYTGNSGGAIIARFKTKRLYQPSILRIAPFHLLPRMPFSSTVSTRRRSHCCNVSTLFILLVIMTSWGGSTGFCQPCRPVSRRSTPAAKTLLPLNYSPKSTVALTLAASPEDAAPPPKETPAVTGWRSKLLQASNWASLLCVLDCTALPVVTLVLPLFGLVAATPAQMEFLHWLGHQVALVFVLPVGGSATLLNYLYAHQQKRIAALGMVGLMLVALANAPHSVLHLVEHQPWLYSLVHFVHHGIAHRVTNLLGCACLLGSNYWSKQSGKCLHGHDHSECSSSSSDHNHNH